jgi:hypothetical protein
VKQKNILIKNIFIINNPHKRERENKRLNLSIIKSLRKLIINRQVLKENLDKPDKIFGN